MFVWMLLGVGCDGGSAPTVCYRPDDWREKVVVEGGIATVVLTEDCELDLTVTEASLNGAGFSAELPEVGDVISAGTWSIDVSWDDGWLDEGVVEDGSTFSATLSIAADGLDEQPAKELTYTVGE